MQVIEGRGKTQVRGGPILDIVPGDVITVGPGEEHWHGAGEGAALTHLSVSVGSTEWNGGAPDRTAL